MKYFFSLIFFLPFSLHVMATDEFTGGLMNLSAAWEFYPGKFLSAEEMIHLNPEDKYKIPLTQNWAKLKKDGKYLPVMGIGTYYKQIVLKCEKAGINNYGFWIGTVMSAYQIFVNDKLILRVGSPTVGKQGFKPMCCAKECNFNCTSDTVNLVLQVSNFYYPKYGGVYNQSKMLFGKLDDVRRYSFIREFLFSFLISCFLVLFGLQMFFGFINRKEPLHFLIAILSLLTPLEIVKEGDAFWFSFFPDFNVALSDKIWYLTYPAMLLVLLITKLSFRDLVNKYVERAFYISYAILVPIFAVNDTTFLFRYSFVPACVNIMCVIYMFIVLVKAVALRKDYSWGHISAFVALSIGIMQSIFYVQELVDSISLLSSGVLLYIIIQSAIILAKFGRSRSLAIKLSHELEHTNLNLEQIVDTRTVELKHANEELLRINIENMKLAEQKANVLQSELSKKEREMITAAVSIFQNKKLLSALKADIFNEKIKYNKEQSAYLDRVVNKYDNLANSFNWTLFEKRFIEINQDFYVKLIKDFPELTMSDLKICAFYYIGLSMKEIALLNYSNYEAIRKAVYRIRKKMKLDENVELSIFLQEY